MAPLVRRVLLSLWTVAGASAVVAQSPMGRPAETPASGVITGQTLNGSTGKVLSGVIVTLSAEPVPAAGGGPPAPPPRLTGLPMRALVDAAGRFVFREVPKGSYVLSASRAGYTYGVYGAKNPTDVSPETIVLGDGERRGELTISLWKFPALSGSVVDETGEPLIGVQVRMLRRSVFGGRLAFQQAGNTATTDDRGMYRIASLPPGDYVVGIVTTQTTVPTSLQAAGAAAVKAGNSDLQSEVDRSGQSFNVMTGAGQRVGSWVLRALGPTSMSPPVDRGKVFVYPSVFYPAAGSIAEATIVTLAPGADRAGIDFQLRPVVANAVSGTLSGLNGPEANTMLDLLARSADDSRVDFEVVAASTVSDATGAFTFLGVTPGLYAIRVLKMPLRPQTPLSGGTVIQSGGSMIMSSTGPSAAPPIPDGPTLWANTSISVEDRDVTGVSVSLATGARLGGHVEFQGASAPPTADRLGFAYVQIDPADGRPASPAINQFALTRGVINARGDLTSYQLAPGRYVVRATSPWPGWTFKGAYQDGRDVSDAPLELGGKDVTDLVLVFTDRPTELSGATHDSNGLDPKATVLVFPEDAALWKDHGPTPRRLKTAHAGSDAKYRFTGLPAGDYLLVAVDAGTPSDWTDVKSLQRLAPIATRITIADGEKKSLDLETRHVK